MKVAGVRAANYAYVSHVPKPRPQLPQGPFLVVGLARSGLAAARLLAARGETVIATDIGAPDGARRLSQAGVEVVLDADGADLVERVGCVVKSPGVPPEAPAIRLARERGTVVIGELELAWRLLPNRFVAVTGTYGKTTVSELLGHLWRSAGLPVAVAGNIGTPLSSLVDSPELDTGATLVCEASSFQLEDTDGFAPEVATLLNIAPDHLDRHGTIDAYTKAKLRLFERQTRDDVAIAGAAEIISLGARLGDGARVSFGREAEADARLDAEAIWWHDERLVGTDELQLLGDHNALNATAAAATALAAGVEIDAVRAGLRSFEGVAHRLEPVAEIAGVTFVNDSKATNVAAAVVGLRAFDGGVRAILGGSLKGERFHGLADAVRERCLSCYLVGEAAELIEQDLQPAWAAGVEHRRCESLEEAVRSATADALAGDVVLLVPACASFDAYRDYAERGAEFKRLVKELA